MFLAPIADVGGTDVGQNFVQRAGVGIFYGLDQGSFFSDDIGNTAILNSIPSDTLADLAIATAAATAFTVADGISTNDDVFIDSVLFSTNLFASANATASAGQTNAASASRSTAASQTEDEEEVAEVDEVAFQNLKNFDENPQGILLPEHQYIAYDEEGNIYFNVTLGGQIQKSQAETYTLYKVRLDLEPQKPGRQTAERSTQAPNLYGYRPEFMKLNVTSGDE